MTKKVLRVIAVILSLTFLFSIFLMGCSSEKAAEKQPETKAEEPKKEEPKAQETQPEAKKARILFVSPMVGHPVWLGAKEGLDAAAKEFGFDGVWMGADDHAVEKTVEAFEQAIAEKPDGIVTCPFSPSAFSKALDKAKAANIPVTVVAVDAEKKEQRTAFIGTNSVECGKKQAEALAKKVGKPLKIGVIMSNLDSQNQVIQVDAMKEYIKSIPGSEVVDIQEDRGDQVKAMDVLNAMIKAHPDMNCVFGTEGGGAPGFAKVLEEQKLTDKLIVISMDDTEQNLAVVKEGKIYGLMAQNFFKMGYLGAKYAWEASQGKQVTPETDSGVTLITKENVDTYKQNR